MAVYKCKMCGGDLTVNEGSSVCECEYCGSMQTVPSIDDEKKMTLFNRANRLRFNCEFDKAAGVYESIVAEFPEEAEAYWGLVLCKYGIEYVDDPATAKKIPTCHRSSFDSVMDDKDFEMVMDYSDPVSRRVYREEAKQFEEIRKGIIEISGKEEPYDIFICYKETDENGQRTLDSVLAQDIYDALVGKGYHVFFSRITLEDKLGQEYEPYIFAALHSAKIMLAVGTDYEYYNAVWVKNEWSRYLKLIAAGEKKVLIPCYKGIDAYDMPKEFARLQAQDLGKVGAMQDLIRGIEKVVGKETKAQETIVGASVVTGPNVSALLKRGYMSLEDSDWDKATGFFDQVLNLDAECSDAYIGIFMSEHKLTNQEAFTKEVTNPKAIDPLNDKAFQRALKFCNEDKAKYIESMLEERKSKCEEWKGEQTKRLGGAIKKANADYGIADSNDFIARVKPDGTVDVRLSYGDKLKKVVSKWTDIVSIAAGTSCIIGLHSDGTVVANHISYSNYDVIQDVSDWKDIVGIAAGDGFVVGLHSDGTVVATGSNKSKVSDWENIVSISARGSRTIGIKADGSVVITDPSLDVSGWRDIVCADSAHHASASAFAVGLCSDGTVVTTNEYDVSSFTDIVKITIVGNKHIMGLRSDGKVVMYPIPDSKIKIYEPTKWRDIVSIYACQMHAVGVHTDGSVVTTSIQIDITDWKLFLSEFEKNGLYNKAKELKEQSTEDGLDKSIEILKELGDFKDSRYLLESCQTMRLEILQKKQESLIKERDTLTVDLNSLSGLFTGKRRREIENRLAEIRRELG